MGISSWFRTRARYPVNGCGAVGTKTKLSRPEGERCSSSGASPMSSPIECRPWRGNGRRRVRVLGWRVVEGENEVGGVYRVKGCRDKGEGGEWGLGCHPERPH